MPRVGLTTERIVLEGADLADALGLERLTLAAIAERVGVAQPSLYKHIPGLDALRRELAVLGLRELTERLLQATAGKACHDALRAMADAYRRYAHEHPGRYQASVLAPEPDDGEHTQAGARILAVAAAVLDGYGISGADAIDAIRAVRAALHGYVVLERTGGYRIPRSRDTSFDRLVSILDDGLTNWNEPGPRSAPTNAGP